MGGTRRCRPALVPSYMDLAPVIANATDGVHFDYPAVADVIQVTVAHTTDTHFLITIKDVSSGAALVTSTGNVAAPLSPGVWVVHNGSDPLYTVGMPDRGAGLERIAEDGNPATLGAFVAANVGITYPASPGVWVVHSRSAPPRRDRFCPARNTNSRSKRARVTRCPSQPCWLPRMMSSPRRVLPVDRDRARHRPGRRPRTQRQSQNDRPPQMRARARRTSHRPTQAATSHR